MANTIALAQKFIPMLDEVYQAACLTAVLDGAEELVQQGANANELIVPMLQLQGLGDYDRNTGYAAGDVTLTNETVKCNFDRGRMFSVDNMDNEETAGVAFGHLAGEFIRTKVAPELDAFRFASYCSKEGVTPVEETLDDGAKVIAALRKAVIAMDEAEVPAEERYLFITPTLYGMVEDMETTSSRQVLGRFAGVMQVPHTRFYTAIQQKVIEGAENSERVYTDFKHYEVAPCFSYTNHLVMADVVIANRDFLADMSEDDRETFYRLMDESMEKEFSLMDQSVEEGKAEAAEKGAQYFYLDTEVFKEQCMPLLLEIAGMSETTQKIYDQVEAIKARQEEESGGSENEGPKDGREGAAQ